MNPLDHGHLTGSTPTAVTGEAQKAATINDPINVQKTAAFTPTDAQGDRGQPAPSIIVTVLPLSEITVDTSIQCRASVNRKTVEDYAKCMKNGDTFPALDAFNVEARNLLADGFQRIEAARQAGFKSISVRIRQGTRKDAVKFAIEANRAHGLRFNNQDKRHAVKLCLEVLADHSDGAIAHLVGVSQPFVSKLRGQLKSVMSCDARTGRDGKKRSVSKKNTATAKTTGQSATASTDEQAHGTDARGASAKETTGGSATTRQDSAHSAEYDFSIAWKQTEDFLRAELEKCPEHLRSHFCQKLRNFVADASGRVSGVTSDAMERPATLNADVSASPSGATPSSKVGDGTPAKAEGRRKAKATTVRDHVSKLRNGLGSIAAELRQRQAKASGIMRNLGSFKARGQAITNLEAVVKQLASIVASLGIPGDANRGDSGSVGDLPFSTHIVPRGSGPKRVQRMIEIVTAVAKTIEAQAPKAHRDLQDVAAELTRMRKQGGL
jgi:hypothetical protein